MAATLTAPEAARHLGVPASTLRRWANDDRIRHVRLPSGRLRFDLADLDAYLAPRGSAPAA